MSNPIIITTNVIQIVFVGMSTKVSLRKMKPSGKKFPSLVVGCRNIQKSLKVFSEVVR